MTKTSSTSILFEGITIRVTFKPIRTLRLMIRRDGTPALSVPIGMSQEKVMGFLEQHREWMKTKLAEVQQRFQKETSAHTHDYTEGDIFHFLGKAYPLQFAKCDGPAHVTCEADCIQILSRNSLTPNKVRLLLQAWYARQFEEIIRSLVAEWLIRMQERPIYEIRFRKMTSRWGSCAPTRRILCFNTRLVFKPLACIEEVVVHELCHLKEASHNARFHAWMAHYLPDYKERNKILNQ